MNSSYIFWPLLAQVFLTLIMFIMLGVRKELLSNLVYDHQAAFLSD